MEPDGYLTVYTYVGEYQNDPKIWFFKDIKFWSPNPWGLSIETDTNRTVYPWGSVLRYEVTKNSNDYYHWYVQHKDDKSEKIDPRKHPQDAHKHTPGD